MILFSSGTTQKQPPGQDAEVVARRCFIRPANLSKKRFWHMCFPVNFAKFLKTPFFIEHPRWLLLKMQTTNLYYLQSSNAKTTKPKLRHGECYKNSHSIKNQ